MSATSVRSRNAGAKNASKKSQLVEESDVVKFVVPELTVKDLLSAIP